MIKVDHSYQILLMDILNFGVDQNDRTSVGKSKQLFGETIRFSTDGKYAPLLQCRTMSPRIAFEEFIWMMCGSTNVKFLQKKNIHIWDGNSTREFLDSRGLTEVPEYDIGKAYGYQFRRFGGLTDQVMNVFKSLRDNPTSRRHVVSIWNPNELHEMALEPCFHLYEFMYQDGTLHLYVHGRSSDVVFGLPYNLAFSYFWLKTFADALGYKTGDILVTLTNAHIYENQVELAELIVKEDVTGQRCPVVTINKDLCTLEDILLLEWEDVQVDNWVKGPVLISGVEMAV
jgi:thymidylate synthase